MKNLYVGLCAAVVSFAFAAGDSEAGKVKSAACVACHNADGNSVNTVWPKIAGQHETYLISQLKYLRQGEKGPRNNPLMYPFAVNLTDKDIDDLAAYFSAQKQTPGPAVNQKYAVGGEKIYKGGIAQTGVPACAACHGPAGQGNGPAQYPKIAGQHADYMVAQLTAYKNNERKTSANNIMNMIAAKLTEAQMREVSEYIAAIQEKDKK